VDDCPFPILGRDDGSQEAKEFMTQYDAPAYVRRARQVEEAYQDLLRRCRHQRDQWLVLVRLRLGTLHALALHWERLRPWLADESHIAALERLHAELAPRLRLSVEPTSSDREIRRALRELKESIDYFNARWRSYLPSVDLGAVNELRDGYNRYYVLEKECAVRSARVARQGFVRLEPLTTADLDALLPLLPDLNLRD
jgi:hypothetical protein